MNNVDLYDAAVDRWEKCIDLPAPTYLSAAVATEDGQQVYVTGGITEYTNGTNFLLFDVRSSRWNSLGDLPQPRYGHAAIMDAEGYRLYVIGGITSAVEPHSVAEYDLRSAKWRHLASGGDLTHYGVTAVRGPDDIIYALAHRVRSIQRFDPKQEKWLPNGPPACSRFFKPLVLSSCLIARA